MIASLSFHSFLTELSQKLICSFQFLFLTLAVFLHYNMQFYTNLGSVICIKENGQKRSDSQINNCHSYVNLCQQQEEEDGS